MELTRIEWNEFAIELEKSQNAALDIIQDKSIPFETRYKKFTDIIDKAAWRTIGKTTIKEGKKEKMSKTVKDLQEEKRNIKKQAQKEKKGPEKDALIDEYKSIQEKIHAQIIT